MTFLISGMLLIDALFILAIAFFGLFVYFQYNFQYWKRRGVPFLEPSFPEGNAKHYITKTITFGTETKDWYHELKKRGHKFGGVWTYTRRVLVLVDPEYIRDIMSKDFNYFVNRDVYYNEKHDPQAAHLFVVNSDSWKNLRVKLTPTFTSGKMKMMFHFVDKCSENMIKQLEKEATMGVDVDIREILARFTTDVIATVAFGIESNTFENPDTEFRKMGLQIFNPDIWSIIKALFAKNFPELSHHIGLTTGQKIVQRFFASIVEQTVKYREENDIVRPDFIQLLMDLKKSTQNTEKPFNNDQMVANSILFFIAGFDTSSTTMNFSLYELARHPEIQEKAREEIFRVLAKHNGELNYDSIKEMTFIRQVMDESLRMYPALPTLARVCVQDYKLRDTDIIVEKGTTVVIPAIGLGWDDQYFPNPGKFDPDRFSPENKPNIPPYVHLPFGEGPRNCIGLRFGIMQSTIGIVQVLKHFRISISPATKMPLTLNSKVFLLKSNETLYLKLEKL